MKQKDVESYAKSVLGFFNHPHPYVRFEALNCMSMLSKDFSPKI